MTQSDDIQHDGTVLEAGPDGIKVEILAQSACEACHASALCSMSSRERKIIDVPAQIGYVPGEQVIVGTRRSMGEKAVRIAYVYPLLILVAVLVGTLAFGLGELYCGLIAIAAVGLWYFGVWLMRNRLKNEYTFYIRKKQ